MYLSLYNNNKKKKHAQTPETKYIGEAEACRIKFLIERSLF